MADNTKQNDNDTISTDEIGAGVKVQRVKVQCGGDGEAVDVSAVAPLPVGGGVAHDAADAGNPVKVGGRARTALPAAVSQDDRSDLVTDKHGRLLIAFSPLDEDVSGTLNRTNETAGQVIAGSASKRIVVTSVLVTNAHATVGTKVEILDNESVKIKGYAGPAGGGFSLAPAKPLFIATSEKDIKAKCVTTGADVDISISGYKIPG